MYINDKEKELSIENEYLNKTVKFIIMAITKVWIEEGCTACGLCSELCPEVFELNNEATVIKGVNYSEYEQQIKEAVENCPVEVIKYNE